VHLIFQPAQEGLGSAAAMIADSLFDRFPCDAVFGMHNRPSLAVGKFQIRTGPMAAGCAWFNVQDPSTSLKSYLSMDRR
jgi:hippurate hydrolase